MCSPQITELNKTANHQDPPGSQRARKGVRGEFAGQPRLSLAQIILAKAEKAKNPMLIAV